MARRWRWPAESVSPRSPRTVSQPSGSASMNRAPARARGLAQLVVGGVAARGARSHGRSCGTGTCPAARRRSRAQVALHEERRSVPPTEMAPSRASQSRNSRLAHVDFPAPEWPTSATRCPARSRTTRRAGRRAGPGRSGTARRTQLDRPLPRARRRDRWSTRSVTSGRASSNASMRSAAADTWLTSRHAGHRDDGGERAARQDDRGRERRGGERSVRDQHRGRVTS